MNIEQKEPLFTFYVDVHNQSEVECPHCGLKKTVDASKFKGPNKVLNFKCRCGEKFMGFFEFRRFYRKKVDLEGVYENPDSGEGGAMYVDTLSLDGVGFRVAGPHRIRKGEILSLRFDLDNAKQTRVARKVRVVSVRDQSVGTQFTRRKEFDPELALYLNE